ncbi:molybdopterin molybdenumtransferase MoeA [Paenibacillus sp. CAA11]|uniref:molybdopterin molybdotransferase MoeA n=1 Tax=Paenibacillus sp. CAA11 TaxID=1532905 RepID=UPI000D38B57A|nr:gephyrin-like molybdotransferase Glp [Paenibacillus sp. CAA11]AWB44815.1 molybdopterin molybdenumtransferase MoeA [Paenibacillus sp. CAA11]
MNAASNSSSKFRRTALQVADAQQLILPRVPRAAVETVNLIEAQGRILAEKVIAPHPYPHFRRSGMDGFALRSEDTKGASSEEMVWLEVVDEIPCGSLPSVVLKPGMVARIMTGAKVPDEADAVVMLEMTETRESGGTFIGLKREIEAGKNVTPVGQELAQGELILDHGRAISAGEISVLATFGIANVQVAVKPRVAIFSTGSELLRVDEPLQDGKIRNSNTYTLAAQVRAAGAEPFMLEAIEDDLVLAKGRVEQALAEYDFVITTGGVSVGDFDIMADLVREDGVELLFNKIAMRPGSVTTAAVKNGKLLFALSGNPGACFVGFELFVRPAIQTMMGSVTPYLTSFEAILGSDYNKVNNFTRFVRGRTEIQEGKVYVYPAALDESSVMITIKDSDCLIVIPPTTNGVTAGESVQVLKLSGTPA